jgi:Aldo/keto reductase family
MTSSLGIFETLKRRRLPGYSVGGKCGALIDASSRTRLSACARGEIFPSPLLRGTACLWNTTAGDRDFLQPFVAAAGVFKLGDLTVNRLGYWAMQLAGPHVLGPPKDRNAAVAVLREAIARGVNHIDTSDFYGPHVTNQIIREALQSLSLGSP